MYDKISFRTVTFYRKGGDLVGRKVNGKIELVHKESKNKGLSLIQSTRIWEKRFSERGFESLPETLKRGILSK